MTETSLVHDLIPYWPGIVTIIGAMIVGLFAVWNRKKGNMENRAPSAAEAWKEADLARGRLRKIEDAYWIIRHVFQGYYHRVSTGGSTELTTSEHEVINARPLDYDTPSGQKA